MNSEPPRTSPKTFCSFQLEMSSSEATPSSCSSAIPFRSKKALRSSSKCPLPDLDPLSSKTPEKAPQLPRRVRNRNALLSIKEVRRAAASLDESNPQKPQDMTERKKSARRKIDSWEKESSVSESKNPTNAPAKLPERYEILNEFFDSLDSAIRLSKLKGSSSTFANISPKIECLTDRRFSYGHLAQLMFILPEVVEVKKVLVFDERTSCMKPDLHVTICSDAIEKDMKSKTGSGNMHLRKLFRTRLADFANSHPQDEEVPKAILPEPFNRLSQDHPKPSSELVVKGSPNSQRTLILSALSNDEGNQLSFDYSRQDPTVNESEASNSGQIAVATHISKRFSWRFSKETNNDAEIYKVSKIQDLCSAFTNQDSSLTTVSSDMEKTCSTVASSSKLSSMEAFNTKCSEICSSPVQLPSSRFLPTPCEEAANTTNNYNLYTDAPGVHSTPAKLALTPGKLMISTPAIAPPRKYCMSPDDEAANTTNNYNLYTDASGVHSTPAKLALTPGKLMISTPAIAPPRKYCMSPDDDILGSPNKLVRRPRRSRSLKFDTPVKNETKDRELDDSTSVADNNGISDILPQSLLQSIREKERKIKEEQDPAISQARRRQKMITRLPNLFNMIHFLLQSMNRSVITKEELIHKLIAGHLEIVDRRELEEQLSLLFELLPEWISEKKTSGGDLLLCVNKLSSPGMTMAQLEKAT